MPTVVSMYNLLRLHQCKDYYMLDCSFMCATRNALRLRGSSSTSVASSTVVPWAP